MFIYLKECTTKIKQDKHNTVYAAKIVNRTKLSPGDDNSIKMEVALLRDCHHVNIVNCVDFVVEPATYYIVMELCKGGELFDRIVAKKFYNEAEARGVVRQLLAALQYIHGKNIAHRDLKPENLLLAIKDSDDSIKLADFGFATRVNGDTDSLTQVLGTPGN